MKIERAIGRHRIGNWDFLPGSGELRRRSDVRRLEPRAARALELLCEAEGEVVTHEQLIAGVWNGRSLSDNSVSVVIGQLRRALDDDAKVPRLIETIPKRGYRLSAGTGGSPVERGARRPVAWAVTAALLLSGLAAAAILRSPAPPPPPVLVSDVSNETGDPANDLLVRATSELIVTGLNRRGFAVRRAASGASGDGLRFRSKLVMWNNAPSLGMTATDSDGVVRWSGMTNGPAARIPTGVGNELDRFAKTVAPAG